MRAFTYVFDDPQWLNKIAITAILTAVSALLTPVLVGLLGWAALLGYMVELVRNVRLGVQYPMPQWDDFNHYLSGGFNVLTAFVVYSLPNLVLGCVGSVVLQNLGGGFVGSTLALAFGCCLFPILLIYNLAMLPMLALGVGRYVDDPRLNVFFEFSFLFETLRQHLDQVVQWWLAALAADLVFAVLGVILLVGWVVQAALLIPVFGMLCGQLALTLLGGLKPKNKPVPRR